jgi:2-methylcitrate dehydratase PrpD
MSMDNPTPEQQLARFVVQQQAREMPDSALLTTRRVFLAAVGTAIAGSGEDGIAPLRELLLERGGTPQATTMVFGDKLPADAAAQLNGTMARALDFCDAMAPGIHIGSSLVTAAFAAAELAGGCSGAEFLSALAVGCELGARFNLTEAMYDGFDPTGVAIVFSSTAAAARVLRLTEKQTLNALGLAFNRCGGSFQSNIDGTLAVRVIQGWVAQAGVECAEMARRGITGPTKFLTGIYGYAHLYGRGKLQPAEVVAGLGSEWRLERMMFKKYPSCGATQGLTELTLQLLQEFQLKPQDVQGVEVRLNPYCHKLVGHPFEMGDNPRVNAQFSVQYCVANAIVRGSSKLPHFRPEAVADPAVHAMLERVTAIGDPALDARGHTAVDVTLTTTAGKVHERKLDIAPGYPGNGLTDEQHLGRFEDCMAYAARPLAREQVAAFLADVQQLPSLPDARGLLRHLLTAG